MDSVEFKARTKRFGMEAIRLVESLPRGRAADVIARQLLRSATSVGANYRAACRGRSNSEVVAKLGIVEEEADESLFWLEMIAESDLMPADMVKPLYDEGDEILRITVASIKTARRG